MNVAVINTPSNLSLKQLDGFNHRWMPEVLAYKNNDVVERIEKKLNLAHEDAALLFSDTLKFLAMCGLRGDEHLNTPLVPPKSIDEAWHHFLMFTEDYMAFCERYFGGFLHHRPSTSKTELRGNRIPETIALAKALFGATSDNWTHKWLVSDLDTCSGTTNCQVCYKG